MYYMIITGTKEAFSILIHQKGFTKKWGYNKSVVSSWKVRDISEDKMQEVLKACGATVKKDKVWKLKKL